MPFTRCHLCAGEARAEIVVKKFTSRECGHVYCRRCEITHDTDVDDISTGSMTSAEIESLSDENEYRKLFVETSAVRDDAGNDYGNFKWDNQEELRKGVTSHIVEAIERHLESAEELSILDLGCGSGFTSVAMADALPTSRVVSVDPSPQVLGVDGYAGRIRAYRGTMQALGERLDRYDVIVIVGNLMLHDDPFDTLVRAERHLRPGGLLIFDFKNVKSSTRQLGVLAARVGIERFVPSSLFARNFVNMRFGFHEKYIDSFMESLPLDKVGRSSKPPRLLEFSNRSAYTASWKGLLWRALDAIDRLRAQQAWIQLEYRKSPSSQAEAAAVEHVGVAEEAPHGPEILSSGNVAVPGTE